MPLEIERRFIIANDGDDLWRDKGELIKVQSIFQGYLVTDPNCSVRVRFYFSYQRGLISDTNATLTVKIPTDKIGVRHEFEYPLEKEVVRSILASLPSERTIRKRRFTVRINGVIWELDQFIQIGSVKRPNLVLGEVELPDINTPLVIPPSFVLAEVTDDDRFSNLGLLSVPDIDALVREKISTG